MEGAELGNPCVQKVVLKLQKALNGVAQGAPVLQTSRVFE